MGLSRVASTSWAVAAAGPQGQVTFAAPTLAPEHVFNLVTLIPDQATNDRHALIRHLCYPQASDIGLL
jgi:hypothetical protein